MESRLFPLFRRLVPLIVLASLAAPARGAIANGGFESGLEGWRPLYTRDPGTGTAQIDREVVHAGLAAVRLEHRGTKDWSFETAGRLAVAAGDVWELQAWLKVGADQHVTLGVATWDQAGRNVSWSHGAQTTRASAIWQKVQTRFVIPDGVTHIQPRLLGGGPVVVWADDFSLERKFNLHELGRGGLPAAVEVRNPALTVALHTADATLTVTDHRAQRTWTQRRLGPDLIVQQAAASGDRIDVTLYHVATALAVTIQLILEADRPEFTATLEAAGPMPASLTFPQPFAGVPGDSLVVPLNEGIAYPITDPAIPPMRLVAYGGHGICMAFWGLTDGRRGQMAILETPDDAAIRLERIEQRLVIAPVWEAQRGDFGYPRRVRYVFLPEGGHVAMAKRYRAHARATGLFQSLDAKRRANPSVDRLLGAVNVWCWDRDAVGIVREMQAAGIERILWSNRQDPATLAALNARGVLTSRYDIYQDVMDPANFPRLRGVQPDWPTAAWPHDVIVDRDGQRIPGWGVTAKDGTMISCGVLCDRRALAYARARVPADLASHPYLGRFIDTTTASPWRECYHPDHPMTRTESKRAKMELLRYMSEDSRLVTGCETGHDAAVPYLHFLEGMMSLGPYRVPDAGRRMQQIWDEVPEPVAKFQLGHTYRLPLFELVFHECVVSYWYWGDYNNKLPALWDKRDLFNVLYGVPPMFMFDRKLWSANQARFVQSYRHTCPVVQKVATSEMTDHRFLTPDRDVQQTRFANGTAITVNFGSMPFALPGGGTLGPRQYHVATAN